MDLKKVIGEVLLKEGIDCYGILPAEELKVISPRMMPAWAKSAILMAIPYHDGSVYRDGVSAYAHIPDYHRFFTELFDRMIPELKKAFPESLFFGSADHSPIHEKEAAAKAGLGFIGRHSMLINPKYGSYLFLGSILTDLETDEKAKAISYCEDCGRCGAACPGGAIADGMMKPEKCLSALSQKKKLTDEEKDVLKDHHIAWGCDRCQEVCPYNSNREFSKIAFFAENRHGDFTSSEVASMSDEDFLRFAFSWRGRDRIRENLSNLENLGE